MPGLYWGLFEVPYQNHSELDLAGLVFLRELLCCNGLLDNLAGMRWPYHSVLMHFQVH